MIDFTAFIGEDENGPVFVILYTGAEMPVPSYVQFLDKSTGETVFTSDVDEAVCRHLGVDPHPTDWYENWFNVVGLLMAVDQRGVELRDKIRECFVDEPVRGDLLCKIDKFLEETYDIRSWTTIGRSG